jgi:aminoglycoside phosphotransferase (APT) family kinase protein
MRPVPTPTRQLCAVLRDGHVLTDESGQVPGFDTDERHTSLVDLAVASGDADAVLVAPQLQVTADPCLLLSVFAPRAHVEDQGTWTPLPDLAADDRVVELLRDVDAVATGRALPPARRPDWFRTTWYDEVETWVDRQLTGLGRRRTGPVRPTKVWSLSAVLEVPTDAAPVWFKAACAHFHAEPALTRLVAEMVPGRSPVVIATHDDRGWVLTEDISGADEDAVPDGVGPPAARTMAALQLRSLDHLDELAAAGVPVRDLATTGRQFDELLASSVELAQLTPDEIARARACSDAVHDVLEELDSLSVPTTLVHGDLHPGNVAHSGDSLVLYDWSDASVSHPFLDAALLGSRLSDTEREETLAAYAEVWRSAYPDLDVDRALHLAVPANTIYQMVTFEQIYQAQEPASYWEMSGVVARYLRQLPDRFPVSGG